MFTRFTQICVLALLLGSFSALALRDGDRDGDDFEGRDRNRGGADARGHRDRDREHDGDREHKDGDRDRDWEGDDEGDYDDDGDYDERDFDGDDFGGHGGGFGGGDDPFGGGDDEGDFDDEDFGGDDPFGGDDEMWMEDQVRRVMGRGGLEAVSRMVSHELGTPPGEFLEFVRKHMPEVTQAKGPRATDMVLGAVHTYGNYVDIREHDPEQAELMVAHDRMEMMSDQLAENIEILRRRARRDGNTEVKQALAKNTDQLKQVLSKLFELRQKQQEFEVRELEAEVQELRELATRRAENRERIIERQFLELTGQGRALEW
jgi:hypothetical protein